MTPPNDSNTLGCLGGFLFERIETGEGDVPLREVSQDSRVSEIVSGTSLSAAAHVCCCCAVFISTVFTGFSAIGDKVGTTPMAGVELLRA